MISCIEGSVLEVTFLLITDVVSHAQQKKICLCISYVVRHHLVVKTQFTQNIPNTPVCCGWSHNYIKQVIKNIRNVTRHRNGQSVKSRQTRWERQLLISIMHIHAVVTRYNSCAFLCAWHVNITVFFALPPCCVDESYSRVCVLVDDNAIL